MLGRFSSRLRKFGVRMLVHCAKTFTEWSRDLQHPSSRHRGILLRGAFETSVRVEEDSGALSPVDATIDATIGALHLGIVVTTFEKRQDSMCLPLVGQLRTMFPTVPIIVFVNGNLDRNHNLQSRNDFLVKIHQIPHIDVVCSRVMTGISRNWNLGVQLVGTEVTWILSDDVSLLPGIVEDSYLAVATCIKEGIVTFGGTDFSSFMISRDCIEGVGWFDERYLGFGWEDHDYGIRYKALRGKPISNFFSPNIAHHDLSSAGAEVKSYEKYSLFNSIYHGLKHPNLRSFDESIPGESAVGLDQDFHPFESFRRRHNELLKNPSGEEIKSRLILEK